MITASHIIIAISAAGLLLLFGRDAAVAVRYLWRTWRARRRAQRLLAPLPELNQEEHAAHFQMRRKLRAHFSNHHTNP